MNFTHFIFTHITLNSGVGTITNPLKQNIMKLDLNAMEQARLDMAQEGIIMTPLTQEDRQLLQSILN